MRSWRSLAVVLAVLATACGNDAATSMGDDTGPEPDACETSYLRYDNFGAIFSANWCRGCHSASVPADMRQMAPTDVNFDSEADLVEWKARIRVRATGDAPTMPPAGGPSADERALLAEWIDCGMK